MRLFEAVCLRDCVQDGNDELRRPYVRYRANQTYTIREDSPVLPHFRPLEELPKKEAERVAEEEDLARPVGRPRGKRANSSMGPGYAEL